jgi:hypothetical protein
MKITVNESLFLQSFRQTRPDQFSRAALVALFEWLEEIDRESGSEMDLDVIAICCYWTEYSDEREAAEVYGWEEGQGSPLDFLRQSTTALEFSGGVLVLNF